MFACVFDTSDDERTTNTTTSTSNTLKLSGSSWIDNHTQANGYIYKDTFSFNSDGTFLQHTYYIRPDGTSTYLLNIGTWTNDESSSPMSYTINYTSNQTDYKADGSVNATGGPFTRNYTYKYKIENSKLYMVKSTSYSTIADLNNTEFVSTNTTTSTLLSSLVFESIGEKKLIQSFATTGAYSALNNTNSNDYFFVFDPTAPLATQCKLGAFFRIKNNGTANLTNVPVSVYLKKSDGTKIDFFSENISLMADSTYPSETTNVSSHILNKTKFCYGDSASTTTITTNFPNNSSCYIYYNITGVMTKIDTLKAILQP